MELDKKKEIMKTIVQMFSDLGITGKEGISILTTLIIRSSRILGLAKPHVLTLLSQSWEQDEHLFLKEHIQDTVNKLIDKKMNNEL